MNKKSWWKLKRTWLLASLAGLILVYLLAMYFVLPGIIQGQIVQYTEDDLGLEPVSAGEVTVDPFTYEITVEEAQFNRLDQEILGFEMVSVDFEPLSSLLSWTWTVDRLQVVSPRVHLRLDDENRLNWQSVLERVQSGDDSSGEGQPRSIYLDSLRVSGGTLTWSDRTRDPEANLSLDSLALQSDSIRWPAEEPYSLQVNGRLGDTGEVDVTTRWKPGGEPLTAQIDLNNVPLTLGNDYFSRLVRGRWETGQLSLEGRAEVGIEDSAMSLESSLQVDDASMVDDQGTGVLSWEEISVDTFGLNMADRSVRVEGIRVDRPFVEVFIGEGYRTNLGALVRSDTEPQNGAESTEGEEASPWQVSLGPTSIHSARVNFRDENVPGGFSSEIHDLDGTIGRLRSEGGDTITVELEGEADQQTRVAVNGMLNPFQASNNLDMEVDFQNVPITTLSPYTVKFVGYRVDQGTLRLRLNYQIVNRALTGSNHVVIEQFLIGEKVSEDSLFDYPVDLIVALLKDKNGVIDLEIPVSGEVDNLTVDLGQVIRQAVSRMFSSIVSAPFQFLSNLVGTDPEQLRTIEFQPGTPSLSPEGEETVRLMARALNERPRLGLEIQPIWTSFDRTILARQEVDGRIEQAGGRPDDLTDSVSVLERLYVEAYSRESQRDLRNEHSQEESGEFSEPSNRAAYVEALYTGLVDQVEIEDETLVQLAQTRARTVRNEFNSQGISTERIVILNPREADPSPGKWVEFPLSLEVPEGSS